VRRATLSLSFFVLSVLVLASRPLHFFFLVFYLVCFFLSLEGRITDYAPVSPVYIGCGEYIQIGI
jgi:hypothetical protein